MLRFNAAANQGYTVVFKAGLAAPAWTESTTSPGTAAGSPSTAGSSAVTLRVVALSHGALATSPSIAPPSGEPASGWASRFGAYPASVKSTLAASPTRTE